MAPDSDYGPSVGVFAENMDRALRCAEAIPAGTIAINSGSTYGEPHLPFGCGRGTLGGRLTLQAMTELKMTFNRHE